MFKILFWLKGDVYKVSENGELSLREKEHEENIMDVLQSQIIMDENISLEKLKDIKEKVVYFISQELAN